jgi:hypothetical protein
MFCNVFDNISAKIHKTPKVCEVQAKNSDKYPFLNLKKIGQKMILLAHIGKHDLSKIIC